MGMEREGIALTGTIATLGLTVASMLGSSTGMKAEDVNCAPWAQENSVGENCKSGTTTYEDCTECVDMACVSHAFELYEGSQPATPECFNTCTQWAQQFCEI